MDDDDFWGDQEGCVQQSTELARERGNRSQQHFNAGYRDGIDVGKERTLQAGFDVGFREAMAAGLEWGLLRGSVATLMAGEAMMSWSTSETALLRQLSSVVPGISGRHAMLGAAVNIVSQPLDNSLQGSSPLVAALHRLYSSEGTDEDSEEAAHDPVSCVETVSLADEDAGTDVSAAERQEGTIVFPRLLELLTKSLSDFEKATSDAAGAAKAPDMLILCRDIRAQLRELGCDVGPLRKVAAAAAGFDSAESTSAAGAVGSDTEDVHIDSEVTLAPPRTVSVPGGCTSSSRPCCKGGGCATTD